MFFYRENFKHLDCVLLILWCFAMFLCQLTANLSISNISHFVALLPNLIILSVSLSLVQANTIQVVPNQDKQLRNLQS